MDRSKLPLIAPQYEPRYISAADVVALLNRGEVAGVNYEDPRIQEIRNCMLSIPAELDFREARRVGYLTCGSGYDLDERETLHRAWSWWCTAAGHPCIVLSEYRPNSSFQVRCDLTSAGKRWEVADVKHFPTILGEIAVVGVRGGEFMVSDREFLIGGIEIDDAIMIARRLVDYTTAGKFRERIADFVPPPDPHGVLMKPLLPIERSDGG